MAGAPCPACGGPTVAPTPGTDEAGDYCARCGCAYGTHTAATADERCTESRYQWCETHGARWLTTRYQCERADALGADPFQVTP